MRVLLVNPTLPDRSAADGGTVYADVFARALAERAELGLFFLRRPGQPERPDGFEELAACGFGRLDNKTDLSPLRNRTAQGKHLLRFATGSKPLLASKRWSAAAARSLRTFAQEFRPDAALVEFAVMAQYVPELVAQGIPVVLTDHESGAPDPASGEGSRIAATGRGAWADRRDAMHWQRYVRRYYPLANVLQTLTPEDALTLRGQLGRPVSWRSPLAPIPSHEDVADPGDSPPTALFFGDHRHWANPETAAVLVAEVLPRIRRFLPEAKLRIGGADPDGRLEPLRGQPGVELPGFVPKLRDLFRGVRVVIAPAYTGVGSRTKVLVAMGYGLPVVTNRLGRRGFKPPEIGLLEAESADDLAAHALMLLRDSDASRNAGRLARAWAVEHVSPEAVAAEQLRVLEQLAADSPR